MCFSVSYVLLLVPFNRILRQGAWGTTAHSKAFALDYTQVKFTTWTLPIRSVLPKGRWSTPRVAWSVYRVWFLRCMWAFDVQSHQYTIYKHTASLQLSLIARGAIYPNKQIKWNSLCLAAVCYYSSVFSLAVRGELHTQLIVAPHIVFFAVFTAGMVVSLFPFDLLLLSTHLKQVITLPQVGYHKQTIAYRLTYYCVISKPETCVSIKKILFLTKRILVSHSVLT